MFSSLVIGILMVAVLWAALLAYVGYEDRPDTMRKLLIVIGVCIVLLMLGGCAELKTLHHACKDGLCR